MKRRTSSRLTATFRLGGRGSLLLALEGSRSPQGRALDGVRSHAYRF
jgi:hypothetical protein